MQIPPQMARPLGLGQDVFISHCHEDGASYARALHDALEAKGPKRLSCFLDKNQLVAGAGLTSELKRALGRCTVLVVVGTKGAWSSKWVRREIGAYLDSHGSAVRVIRIAFSDAELPADHPFFRLFDDTLAVDESSARLKEAEPDVQGAVDQIREHFSAVRKSRRRLVAWAIAVLAILISLVLALRTDRLRRASLWRDRAQTAEEEQRFAASELMFAEAFRIAGRAIDADGYRRCRKRRDFVFAWDRELGMDDKVVGLLAGDGEPLLVVLENGGTQLTLRGAASSRQLLRGGEDEFDDSIVAAAHDWLAVRVGSRLLLTEASLSEGASARELTVPGDIRDVEVYETSGAMLVEEEDGFSIRGFDRKGDASVRELTSFSSQGTTATFAQLTIDVPGAVVAGDVVMADGSGFAPFVYCMRPDVPEPWRQVFTRRAASQPQVFDGTASGRGALICLALSPPSITNPVTGLRDNRDEVSYVYARLDDGFFRDFELESVFLRSELLDRGGVDAYYRTEAGDLRYVPSPPLVVQGIDRKTLATNVADFACWQNEDQARGVFVQSEGSLALFRRGAIVSRRLVAPESEEVLVSRDGQFVAVVREGGVTVLAVASGQVEVAVPAVEVLEQQLGIRLTSLGVGWGEAASEGK